MKNLMCETEGVVDSKSSIYILRMECIPVGKINLG